MILIKVNSAITVLSFWHVKIVFFVISLSEKCFVPSASNNFLFRSVYLVKN